MFDLKSESISIVGDSMAAGIAIDIPNSPPYEVFQNYTWGDHLSNSTVYNTGASGAQIAAALAAATPVYNQVVIIWCAFNNLKIPEESVVSIVSQYENLYRYYADRDCDVYCIGIPPVNHAIAYPWWPIVTTYDNARPALLAAYMKLLFGNKFIDTYNIAIEAGECKPEYTADGVHPSVLMYEYVLGKIEALRNKENLEQIVDWFDYFSLSTKTGFAGDLAGKIIVCKRDKIVYVSYYFNGTSNGTGLTFTLPYKSASGSLIWTPIAVAIDNSAILTGCPQARLPLSSNVVSAHPDLVPGTWIASGNKQVYGQFFYPTPT
jgi:hypothetical protein